MKFWGHESLETRLDKDKTSLMARAPVTISLPAMAWEFTQLYQVT